MYMENDYRNIPREQLNNNIPKGRGMIKWQPFATMPEQYEKIFKMIEDNAKIEKPIINEDISYQNERLLVQLLNQKAIIRYWSEGYEIFIRCLVEYLDGSSKIVVVSKDNEMFHIPFDNIYEVQDAGYFIDD